MQRVTDGQSWDELMLAAINGDQVAYRRLLEELAPALRAMARRSFARYGAEPTELEDVVQDALLTIHLKRHTWRTDQPLAPWVMAIVRNKLIDALRRRGHRTQVPIDAVADTLAAEPAGDNLERDDAIRLIDRLGTQQQDIVRSISINGQSIREVATRLGMREVAVRVALHRALKKLADLYRGGTS